MLDARLLLFFTTLADELHFGRAAERLGVTQSVLSVGIARLEDQVGARLLDRGARTPVSLTRAGSTFLPEAITALAALDRAERFGRLAARGAVGILRVGYVFSAAIAGPLPALIARVRADAPALDVRPMLMESPEQLDALAQGDIDIGLLRPRASYPASVEARIVHREPMIVALPTRHALAGLPAIDAAMLAGETFVVPQFQESVGMIETLERLARRGGFPLSPPRATSDFVATLALVAGGCGIALIPASLAGIGIAGVAYCSIADPQDEIAMAMAWRSDVPGADAVAAALASTGQRLASPASADPSPSRCSI